MKNSDRAVGPVPMKRRSKMKDVIPDTVISHSIPTSEIA
jgi:hypothetical protein